MAPEESDILGTKNAALRAPVDHRAFGRSLLLVAPIIAPLEALKVERAGQRASADDLRRFAKICRVANVMRTYLEAID